MIKKITLLLPLFAIMLVSCEVEFSPNADWKEVPVVYCMLDQDVDTTWVRVEKCFLGEGRMTEYGPVSDSINYPVGSIRVQFCVYNNGTCIDTIVCRDTVRNRASGNFANTNQPLYFTTATLNDSYTYQLVVTRVADGTALAYTDAIPLVCQNPDYPVLIRKPSNTDRFGFFDRNGTTAVCNIEWYVMKNARLYQPIVRFYYTENNDNDTHFVDLHCNTVSSTNTAAQTLHTYYQRDAFLTELASLLKDDPAPKRSLNKVDLYLTACSEDLNAYISSLDISSAVDQGNEAYTNIHGGVGVFAARRTKLFKPLSADESVVPAVGLVYYLRELGVGF